MKPSVFILFLIFYYPAFCFGQIRIEDCYAKAKANYPLIKQYGLIEKSKDYNLSNAGKGYLPQFQLSAKATYQSEVTEIPVNIPGVEGLHKDQYSVTLDLDQTIWDGGVIGSKRNAIKTQAEVDQKNIDVTMYSINESINQLFFSILLYDAMLEQNVLYQKELQRNYDQITAYINNGIANQSDRDVIKVEQLKAKQNQSQLRHDKQAFMQMLSAFIGERITENAVLQKPEIHSYLLLDINRPELELYDAQSRNMDAMRKEIKAGLMPKLGVFLTGGYGRPGLNMLENEFSAYYIGGVRLTWKFGGLYTRKNDLRVIETNQESIRTRRETFMFNTNLEATQKNSNIRKLNEVLASDDDIVTLRGSIKHSAEVKVHNGTMSVTDYMREVIAEQMAKQDKITHELELIQAIYNLKYITNN
ncbi:transporter [Dysgonomonas sp. 216]|uniref:TolC family protein n=1 Tax=Dysgonomonas sp. 216 TaxID=2302934 RepID=UPI0013D51BA1|nr:TolC family protein [Dysgonomonas sp. 216]NDW18252.1 transporter [Dysgonomonas sp. 216]